MEVDDSDWDAILVAVQSGESVVYPTPNLPALGCLPTKEALDKLYELKLRPEGMIVSLAVASLEQAADLVQVPDVVKELFSSFTASAVTIILPAQNELDSRVGGSSIAVRLLEDGPAGELLRKVGPLTATSANLSGRTPLLDCERAAHSLSQEPVLFIPGKCSGEPPTTLIRCDDYAGLISGEGIEVLRVGMISREEVKQWSTKMN